MIDVFINNQRSAATRRNYAYDLDKWFSFLELTGASINQQTVLWFRNYLEETMASSSAARIFNTCRSYYRWLKGENAFEGIKSPRTLRNHAPKIPSDSDVAGLLSRISNLRHRAVVSLLLNGLRSAEVIELTRGDFQWIEKYNTRVLRVVGKGNKERRVPATLETIEAVSEYQSIREDSAPWLVGAPDGRQLTTRQVQYIVEKYSDYEIRPHALRHHYATRLIRAGASVFAVKELLGHEDIQTTQVYVSLDLADMITEAAKDPRNQRKESNGLAQENAS